MKCKICGSTAEHKFDATILRKYKVKYYCCDNCGFIFTEEPFWLDEAYSNSINIEDTGLLSRNIYFSQLLTILIYFYFDQKGYFVDYAGGYGIFTRLMRDIGFDFAWKDPYTKNLIARGFEFRKEKKVELLTSFESFEHFIDPMSDIKAMLKISKNVAFSTELLPNPVPQPDSWWYYGLGHGQHISFYSEKTLRYISQKLGLNFYNLGGIKLLTDKSISVKQIRLLFKIAPILFIILKKSLHSKTIEDMENLILNLDQK